MANQLNIQIDTTTGKLIIADVFQIKTGFKKPIVVYAHGFAGFKDWGNFNLIAQRFADEGFLFIKFNFSHNGTSIDALEDFVDLEAFGRNNYTTELTDLQQVIDWILLEYADSDDADIKNLFIIGHSMGGGISILKAAEEPSIKKLATWASIGECKTPWSTWSAEKLSEWKEKGVAYYVNGRTGQQMPLYYQLYEDYQNNPERLNIEKAMSSLKIPVLLCHGSRDEAVPFTVAEQLQQANPSAELFVVDSDHVFGRKHPWPHQSLPEAMEQVVVKTIKFFKQ